jgi:hypothetical protein
MRDVALSATPIVTVIGTISSLKRPPPPRRGALLALHAVLVLRSREMP